MNKLIEKTKEEILTRLVTITISLPLILSVVIWQAVDPTIWTQVSDKMPKQALWGAIGILVWLILVLSAYLYRLRKELKRLKEHLNNLPISEFGVYRNKDLNPLCPVCQSLMRYRPPMVAYTAGYQPAAQLHCIKCNAWTELFDIEGKRLNLKQAKERLSSNKDATLSAFGEASELKTLDHSARLEDS